MKFHRDRPTHFYVLKQLLRAFNLLKQNSSNKEMSIVIDDGDTNINLLKQFISFNTQRRECFIPHAVYVKNLGAERFHPTNRKKLLEWPYDDIPLSRADMYAALTHPNVLTTWMDGAIVYSIHCLAQQYLDDMCYSEFSFKGGYYQGLVLQDTQASTDAIILYGYGDERHAIRIVGTKKRLSQKKKLSHGRARAIRDFGDTPSQSTNARGFEFGS